MNAPKQTPKNTPTTEGENSASEFKQQSQKRQPNVLVEFADFLVHNKKWWLTPIIVVLLIFSFFILLTNTAIAPFIYVLF